MWLIFLTLGFTESLASPQPVSPSSWPWLTAPSLLPWPICPKTQLGSLVTPDRLPAVDTQLLPWIFPGFWLHLHPVAPQWRHRVHSFLQPPHRPCSLHCRPGNPSPCLCLAVPLASRSASGFQACDVSPIPTTTVVLPLLISPKVPCTLSVRTVPWILLCSAPPWWLWPTPPGFCPSPAPSPSSKPPPSFVILNFLNHGARMCLFSRGALCHIQFS